MTATLYALPGCTIDQGEIEDQRFVDRTREALRAYLVARTPHPEWCDPAECEPSDEDAFVMHRRVIGTIQGVRVAVEQVDEKDGTRCPPTVRVGDNELLPAEVRKLVGMLWPAHDLAGGAS